jgi:hypothetical protein
MSEIVNLRQARKRKRRAENERTAEANRVQHGRTKGEKLKTSRLNAMAEERHAAHRRDALDGKT